MRTQGQPSKGLVETIVMSNETVQGCVGASQHTAAQWMLVPSLSTHATRFTGPARMYLSGLCLSKQVRIHST